jgi:hypothetical protein
VKLFKRPASHAARPDPGAAMGHAERAIPAGTLIYTSWSPKVEVSHVKSAVNAGSVCEAHSLREDWLGTGSDEEREHARSLRPCPRCAAIISRRGEAS